MMAGLHRLVGRFTKPPPETSVADCAPNAPMRVQYQSDTYTETDMLQDHRGEPCARSGEVAVGA